MIFSDYYVWPGLPVMLEVLLIGFIIALVGAAGYTFFVFAMKDDRDEHLMKNYYVNPWDVVGSTEPAPPPKKSRKKKIAVTILITLAVIVAILALLLVIL